MHRKQSGHLLFESIYRAAYKLVLRKMDQELYDRFQKFEQTWLTENVRAGLMLHAENSVIDRTSTTGTSVNDVRVAGERFMKALKDAYEDHRTVMKLSTDTFMYLVSNYLY